MMTVQARSDIRALALKAGATTRCCALQALDSRFTGRLVTPRAALQAAAPAYGPQRFFRLLRNHVATAAETGDRSQRHLYETIAFHGGASQGGWTAGTSVAFTRQRARKPQFRNRANSK